MKKLAHLLSFTLLFSCGGNIEKPDHLLPEDKMVNILYDIALLQAINSYAPKVLDSGRVDSKNYIYKKYKTDSLTFAQSHQYYASDLDAYEGIQKRVAAKIDQNKIEYGFKKDTLDKKKNSAISKKTGIRIIKPARNKVPQFSRDKLSSE